MSRATEAYKRQVRDAFNAVQVGQVYRFRRTFTEADMSLFCGVTGDLNPYHLDEAFAREGPFGRRIIPGLLTCSLITDFGGMIGFMATEMQFQFLAAVYPGDTITCTVTIVEKDERQHTLVGEGNMVNQDEREVLHASFIGFPSDVRLAH